MAKTTARWSVIPDTFLRFARRSAGADEHAVELHVGDRIHLQPTLDENDLYYPGRIEEVYEDTLDIWVPAATHLPQLRRGRPVRVMLDRDERTYCFDSRIVNRQEVRDPFLLLELPGEVQPAEHRGYFRVSAIIEPARAAVLDARGEEERELGATVLDISGGGIHFVSADSLSRGDRLRVVLPLRDVGEVDTVVEVTSIRTPRTPRGNYRLDARFARLTDQQRDQIFRFLFQEQIKLRKKGLL